MTTFEEDVLECYYISLGYLTLKNHIFSASKKRDGGEGRGEIDLLAVKLNQDSEIEDVAVFEIKFSITSPYPWEDSVKQLIKKFIKQDIEKAIVKIVGKNVDFKFYFAVGIFNSTTKQNLIKKLNREIPGKYKLDDINDQSKPYEKYRLLLTARNIEDEEKTAQITIINFQEMHKFILRYFKKKELYKKGYTDSRFRSIAHYSSIFDL